MRPEFFHPEQKTPWGAGIAYDRRPVRDFLTDNALYWLEEFRLDGLRLDAIDQIADRSTPTIIEELAAAVRTRITDRHIHLTTEDDRNIAHLHERDASGALKLYNGEWNDDFHHAAHVLATSDHDGYYRDYCHDPAAKLARALTQGLHLSGRAVPISAITRSAECRARTCRQLPSSISCRTTTRSATALSASVFRSSPRRPLSMR